MKFNLVLIVFLTFFPALSGYAAAPTVLFDQGHGQVFTVEEQGELQLGRFAEHLQNDGWRVAVTSAPLTPEMLASFHALIISGPFRTLTEQEIDAIDGFLHRGGRLAVMLHIAPPLTSLLDRLGLTFPHGIVREEDPVRILHNNPVDFRVGIMTNHPLTENLPYFSVFGAWPLLPLNEELTTLAATSPGAWVDRDQNRYVSAGDIVQQFALMVSGRVGQGEFVVFADDAIFQNRFFQGENIRLADNLSRWLQTGQSIP